MRSRRSRLCLTAALLLGSAGCGTTYARVPVHEDDLAKVVLRAEQRDGGPVDRGFAHPATIAGVRLAHVLAQIDVRVDKGDDAASERQPAIHTDLVYPLGDLLSRALAQADPSQEVVVEARRKERRLGLFTQAYFTSLVAWVGADGLLYLNLSRLDWPVPKGEEDQPREPVVGREVMAFRVLASEGVDPVGHQLVAVHWRDDRFRRPTTVHVGPSGKATRRTVLMEEEAPAAPEAARPGDDAERPGVAARARRPRGVAKQGRAHRGRVPAQEARDPRG